MSTWAYVAVDTQLGYALADLPLTGVSITLTLNGAGTMTATMPLAGDIEGPRNATVPLRTTIYALVDGNPIFGGLVMARTVNLGANTCTLTIVENWAWFGMWTFRPRLKGTFTDRDVNLIGGGWGPTGDGFLPDTMGFPPHEDQWNWVTSAPLTLSGGLAHGNLRPGYSWPTVTVLREDAAGRSGADVIAGASQAAHPYGFDFGVVHTLGPDMHGTPSSGATIQPYISLPSIWYPWRGQASGRVFEWPGDAVTAEWADDGNNIATRVAVAGGGVGGSTITGVAYNTQLVDRGWPWTETSVTMGQTSKGLDRLAQARAQAALEPTAWPKITVRDDQPNPLGSYQLGDLVRVRITHPWFGDGPAPGVDESWRIQSMVITPLGTADESVALTLMQPWSAT